MQWANLPGRRATAAMLIGVAFATAGCTTTGPVAAKSKIRDTIRTVAGTDLVGARGASERDQQKIDATAAGLCRAGVWTRSECARHDAAAREGGR